MLWYDLETFGLSPFSDRIAEAAAVRTDMDLNIISDPIILYCKLSPDYLPNPESCLVTGITPQLVQNKGVCEAEFIETLNKEFSKSDTVTVGFNNISFDDEFIRNALYRNLYDPYEREYKNRCSRWDILNLVRACHDLRPEGVNFFHTNENGNTSYKLVHLTEDNGIEQEGAHDAMVDVYATINVARLIKTKQPKLYNWYFTHRSKEGASSQLNLVKHTPVLYTNVYFTNEYGSTRPIAPLGAHSELSNTYFAFDLTADASVLKDADASNILSVPGVVKISANKCPYIAPIEMLTRLPEVQKRLHIDLKLMEKNLEIIKSLDGLLQLLAGAKDCRDYPDDPDPDMRIYSDGFVTARDKINFNQVRRAKPQDKLYQALRFDSSKAEKLIFRQVARNWPKYLSDKDKALWKNFCASRLLQPLGNNLSYSSYMRTVDELLLSMDISARDKLVLVALKEYGEKLNAEILS